MIVGKKVTLRPVEEEHLPLLLEWTNDPEISRLVGGWSFPISRKAQSDWYTRSLNNATTQRWIVEVDGEPIGLTGLWEIDWHNRTALTALKLGSSSVRGKGYGTDAIFTVMEYAFHQVGLNKLWGEILMYNLASYRAYIKNCGWTVEGINREHVFRDGIFHDQLRVSILRREYEKLARASDYKPNLEQSGFSIANSDIAPEMSKLLNAHTSD